MWIGPGKHHQPNASFSQRQATFIDRRFQLRYISLLIGATAIGMIVVSIPMLYFINQNYEIFLDLAYDRSPELLGYLEQERRWINSTLVAVFLSLFVFFSLLGYKMTSRMVGPIKVLQNHLKKISRGHWHIAPISVRKDDEFQDLIDTYNYFFNSLRAGARDDLQELKKISVDEKNHDSLNAWKALVNKKSAQLNLPEQGAEPSPLILSDAGAEQSRESRPAS